MKRKVGDWLFSFFQCDDTLSAEGIDHRHNKQNGKEDIPPNGKGFQSKGKAKDKS